MVLFFPTCHDQNGLGILPMVKRKDVRSYKQLNGDTTAKSFTDYLINYKVFIMKRCKSLVEVSMISIRYVNMLLLLPLVAYNDFRKKLPF